MELPSHGEIEESLKRLLVARGNRPVSASQAYKLLAEHFNLDLRQTSLIIKTATGSENAWHNRCRTARNHLVKSGSLNKLPRDAWSLTTAAFRGLTSTAEELGL
ncbi:MAG: hypothetical protein EPN20_05945 [Magnetospirillum sp.]|nr:MAG: hypothetical protein EPN20_05945 [Magnetospirillum sp.]